MLEALAVSIRQASKPAAIHASRQIHALDVASRDVTFVRIAESRLFLATYYSRLRIASGALRVSVLHYNYNHTEVDAIAGHVWCVQLVGC